MSNDVAAPQAVGVPQLPPIETLYQEVRDHRLILQGMAVHLQKLEGELFQANASLQEILNWLEEMSVKEAKDVGDSPAAS